MLRHASCCSSASSSAHLFGQLANVSLQLVLVQPRQLLLLGGGGSRGGGSLQRREAQQREGRVGNEQAAAAAWRRCS